MSDKRRRPFSDERNADIVRRHIDEGLNLSEIGDLYGLTRERVRQIVVAAGQRTLTRDRQRAQGEARRVAREAERAAKREARAAVPFPHGTHRGYNRGCSCDECRAGHRAYMASLVGKPPPTHGVSGYQNYGCRCETCSAAHSALMAHEYLVRKRRAVA